METGGSEDRNVAYCGQRWNLLTLARPSLSVAVSDRP